MISARDIPGAVFCLGRAWAPWSGVFPDPHDFPLEPNAAVFMDFPPDVLTESFEITAQNLRKLAKTFPAPQQMRNT